MRAETVVGQGFPIRERQQRQPGIVTKLCQPLLAQQADFNGTLNLIFQPAEENEGGALRMVDEGLFERYPCDSIYALHNAPGLPLGHMAMSAGPAMPDSRVR